ncbi:hypothetical protein [Mesorhizobium tianshanense]|uniref:Uncharacterized protein n=1 Tax=Mesorhizobium tianshanense TaxID=39844 RepID=A0A562ML27_9HYPH|nr:hypothetical protein [Mesorhizobium tianshanense]TWI20612.1 hypothetical protein IQ26_06971 [Mesorhizobium tianshanense]
MGGALTLMLRVQIVPVNAPLITAGEGADLSHYDIWRVTEMLAPAYVSI